jgi:hypothetical protein
MVEYYNNINRPNLVDLSLLQKINDIQQIKPVSNLNLGSTLIQRAGNAILSTMYDNLFMTVIIVCLILFLAWCYVEKKRQDAIQEKYFQKIYTKSLDNDTEFFTKEPEPIKIQEIFDDINKNISDTGP